MNAAFVLSACVAVLQLGTGVLLLAVSSAPGWREARLLAVIALSAAGYSVGNATSAHLPLSDAARMVGSQGCYLMAALFVAAWLIHAYGDGSGSIRRMSRWAAGLALLCLSFGVLAVTTTWLFVDGGFTTVHVRWAAVQYRFPTPSRLGEIASYVYFAGIVASCAAVGNGRRSGGRVRLDYIAGFALFGAAAMIELLVTNGQLQFLFVADVGYLAVVAPLAADTVRRFVGDAQRLTLVSSHLADEIERRTQERDDAQLAWLEAERQAALGRLAAGVGHEINNPLTYLRLSVEMVGEWGRAHEAPVELMESVESALDGADRIRRVVDALRAYARSGTGAMVPVAPEMVVQAALGVTAHRLRPLCEVRTMFEPTPAVLGDEPALVQVVVNLLLHAARALEALRGERPAELSVRLGTHAGGRAVLEVVDNGAGISREELRRLTTDYCAIHSDVDGVGLGLFLARGVVEQHGGVMEVSSAPGQGTTVRVVLPAPVEAPPGGLELLGGRVVAARAERALLPARETSAAR